MQENELKKEINTSNNNDELVLNDEANKALTKSYNNYIISNGLIILVPMYITVFIYCKFNNIEITPSLYWNVFSSPSFFIPVLIAIFIKDILKYIFFGMSKEEKIYLEEAEKENPSVDGVSKIINANTVKKRFVFISLLYGIIGILLLVLIKHMLNFKTIISFVIAYLYTAHKFTLPYSDFQHIILSKTFLIIFFISLCIINIFSRNNKKEPEQSN